MVETRQLVKAFGGLVAVNKVDFHADQNEIVGLIGPNGAGKTTLFNAITGVYPPTSGSIRFLDRDIAGLLPVEGDADWAWPAPSRTSASSTR